MAFGKWLPWWGGRAPRGKEGQSHREGQWAAAKIPGTHEPDPDRRVGGRESGWGPV